MGERHGDTQLRVTQHRLRLPRAAYPAAAILVAVAAAVTSAADVVFKALLFNYATGRAVPAGIDKSTFAGAFEPRR